MSGRSGPPLVTVLAFLCLLLAGQRAVFAEDRMPVASIALEALYQRLGVGMTEQEVARAAGRDTVPTPSDAPLKSWLLWTPPVAGRPTEVVRTTFAGGRLTRVEYEAFGDEYRHLTKGESGIDRDRISRLWRRSAQLREAAEDCGEALQAFHELVVGFQHRLTSAEQEAWVRALELRRSARRP
jgi:hypothetical protein